MEVQELFAQVIGLLDRRDDDSVEKAKHLVNELVTSRLAQQEKPVGHQMPPVRVRTEQTGGDGAPCTRMNIVARETPAFFYSLSTALSLQGLSIERVRIATHGTHIEDRIDVVDAHGNAITDPHALERVKMLVLLTMQFTYFLDNAPDRYAALRRFEQLSEKILNLPQHGEWLQLLGEPRALEELAKLLGTSDFLWEDFIRAQHEALRSILAPHLAKRRFALPAEQISLHMEQAVAQAADLEQKQQAMNAFKDQQTFLNDLNHILTPGFDFRKLSVRLTMLAEGLVATATRLVHDDLVRMYGRPVAEGGEGAGHAVFGLGKLGGMALGYASDLELLFVYRAAGQTEGGERAAISNTEFFEQLTRRTRKFIATKREGIFEVDLRLRPYGLDGPLACTLDQFHTYYGAADASSSKGPHPFELLALERLRWIAGDAQLGFEVERLRDRVVYETRPLDLDALWELWGRRRLEKMQPGGMNAKFGPGALVDLETTVQLLQVMHATKGPATAHGEPVSRYGGPFQGRRAVRRRVRGPGGCLFLSAPPDQRPAAAARQRGGPVSTRRGQRRIAAPRPSHGRRRRR